MKRLTALLVAAGPLLFASPSEAIIGGNPEDPAKWGSTFIFKTAVSTCSSTLIGRRVILTASYCLGPEKNPSVQMNDGGYTMTCRPHPDALKNQSADFALCVLDRDLAGTPERVNTDSALLKTDAQIYLAGYGCQRAGGIDFRFGDLLVGEARILTLPKKDEQNSHLITNGAALCAGDSGGGAYVYPQGTPASRILVGMNSRSDLSGKSYISTTSSKAFLDWATGWAAENNVSICGIGGNAGCRAEQNSVAPESASSDVLKSKITNDKTSLILPVSPAPGADDSSSSALALQITAMPKETVYDAVTRACGAPQPENYFLELEQRFGVTATTTFDLQRNISIPVCSAANKRYKIVATKEGDTVWKLFQDLRGASQTSSWKGFTRPTGPVIPGEKSEYFLEVFAAINPSIKDLKKLKGAIVIVPTAPLSDSAGASTAAVGTQTPGPEPIFAFQSDNQTCKSAAGVPFDASAILDVLRANRKFDSQPRPATKVFIADSGLYGAGGPGVFTQEVMAGTLTAQLAKSITPPLDGPDSGHGTQVASVVLGGPLFARLQAIWGTRIKLTMSPIYQTYSEAGRTWVGSRDQVFENAMKAAKERTAEIINLSIKTATPILAIENENIPLPNFLFVVAAGNYDGSLDARTIYPARYGGPTSRYVITVAAMDGPAVASWSNFGSDWVDIGAPGCGIPVLSYDPDSLSWKQEVLSGTSLAAPLVTFVAALVKSEKGADINPVSLKRRLLVSADIEPKLAAKIADGRTLNAAKALALFEDVVELNNSRPLLYGSLTFKYAGSVLDDSSNTFAVSCFGEDGTRSLPIGDIFKIHPGYRTVDGKSYAKIYYRNISDKGPLFISKECVLPDTLELGIMETGRTQLTPLPIDQIVDVVRKYQ
jgi:subtilisin family serine protease